MFTIESILGDKLSAGRSAAKHQRHRRPQELYENDGKDAKCVSSPLVRQRRLVKDSPPPLIPTATAFTRTAAAPTAKSRAPPPRPQKEESPPPPPVVLSSCRKRKSMSSDGEDDVSGK